MKALLLGLETNEKEDYGNEGKILFVETSQGAYSFSAQTTYSTMRLTHSSLICNLHKVHLPHSSDSTALLDQGDMGR